ncbi:MAG: DUF1206 domain-containing protein [Flavisolibacter sp.]|nr:DUF1206 domain-containing protein [Flavisolibacter sp.]
MQLTPKKLHFVHQLARYGSCAIGAVYLMVGLIALLSLLRLRHGGADEGSILAFFKSIPLGDVLVGVILLGMLCYITWRIFEAVTDPYAYGNRWKGITQRTGVALSALAYALIALSALQILLNLPGPDVSGQPEAQRVLVAKIFQWRAGEWLVGIAGVIVAFVGLFQFIYAFRKDYEERLAMNRLSANKKKMIHILAWIGHFARGIILLIIAWFLIDAAIKSNPHEVVNTDKAFNYLGEHIGHPVFVLVALGTMCYGCFMFALGFYYDFH